MGAENDDFLTEKSVFGLGEALIGDYLAEGGIGGVDIWGEGRHGLVELGRKSGLSIVL